MPAKTRANLRTTRYSAIKVMLITFGALKLSIHRVKSICHIQDNIVHPLTEYEIQTAVYKNYRITNSNTFTTQPSNPIDLEAHTQRLARNVVNKLFFVNIIGNVAYALMYLLFLKNYMAITALHLAGAMAYAFILGVSRQRSIAFAIKSLTLCFIVLHTTLEMFTVPIESFHIIFLIASPCALIMFKDQVGRNVCINSITFIAILSIILVVTDRQTLIEHIAIPPEEALVRAPLVVAMAFVGLIYVFDAYSQMTANVERHLQTTANQDWLTQLATRRVLYGKSQQLFKTSKDKNSTIGAIILDIDKFKSINDKHGHLVGDGVIRHFALLVRDSLPKSGVLARFGGDEFIYIDEVADERELLRTAHRLHQRCRAIRVRFTNRVLNVSASVGVSITSRPPDSIEQLIDEADQAMYSAKRRGRGEFHRFQDTAQHTRLPRIYTKINAVELSSTAEN